MAGKPLEVLSLSQSSKRINVFMHQDLHQLASIIIGCRHHVVSCASAFLLLRCQASTSGHSSFVDAGSLPHWIEIVVCKLASLFAAVGASVFAFASALSTAPCPSSLSSHTLFGATAYALTHMSKIGPTLPHAPSVSDRLQAPSSGYEDQRSLLTNEPLQ